MAISVQKITLGNVLTPDQREQVVTWMRNNTIGYKRIRAGVPIGWFLTILQRHADKVRVHPSAWLPWNYLDTLAATEKIEKAA